MFLRLKIAASLKSSWIIRWRFAGVVLGVTASLFLWSCLLISLGNFTPNTEVQNNLSLLCSTQEFRYGRAWRKPWKGPIFIANLNVIGLSVTEHVLEDAFSHFCKNIFVRWSNQILKSINLGICCIRCPQLRWKPHPGGLTLKWNSYQTACTSAGMT